MANMAVKVMQLESLLQDKQAELQRMGNTGQAWVEDACRLRDAVAATLAALGVNRYTPVITIGLLNFSGPKVQLLNLDLNQHPVASVLAVLRYEDFLL